MKKVKVEPIRRVGRTLHIVPDNDANLDPIRAARLKRKADAGDKAAKRALAEMEKPTTVHYEKEG